MENHFTTDYACPYDAQKVADVRLQSGEQKMNGIVLIIGVGIIACTVLFHKPTEAHRYATERDDIAIERPYSTSESVLEQRKSLRNKPTAYFRDNANN